MTRLFRDAEPAPQPTDLPRVSLAPPLTAWTTALMIRVFGADSTFALTGASFLAAATAALSAARLGRRLGSPRVGLLTAICCAGHPLLLNSAHTCAPGALGICLTTVAFERFLAHLDGTVGIWSGTLFVAGLAWGGAWLALGWPAASLGVALSLHALIYREAADPREPVEFARGSYYPWQQLRRSLLIWVTVGIATGGWWLAKTWSENGLGATFVWLLDPAPNPISPLFPSALRIREWGETFGSAFLWGWTAIGVLTMVSARRGESAIRPDGRRIAVLVWWVVLLLGRMATSAAGADPTIWDLLQVVPVSLSAAFGMEAAFSRSLRKDWFAFGIIVGLVSLAIHIPLSDSPTMAWSFCAGAVVCLTPAIFNVIETRTGRWRERQIRRALMGLLVGTWLAHLSWGIAQSLPPNRVESRLVARLLHERDAGLKPDAIVLVADAAPSRTLVFQFRRLWPTAPILAADRWETAVSQSFRVVQNWADSNFLVVELTRRDSQFRRPGSGWIITAVGEPRRYHGSRLALHQVRVQTP
jgi:hypothetical protein